MYESMREAISIESKVAMSFIKTWEWKYIVFRRRGIWGG